jgi:hypothetical protein
MIVGSVHTIEFLELFCWMAPVGDDGWQTINPFPYRKDGGSGPYRKAPYG